MQLYITIIHDRHSDVEVEIFTTMTKAKKHLTNAQQDYQDLTWIDTWPDPRCVTG